jgi:RNA polymerase sigma-70 factor, ECF subfamily
MERFDDKAPTVEASGGGLVGGARALRVVARSTTQIRASLLQRLSDETLMALMLDDEVQAFAVLYRRHRRVAGALALQLCGRPAVAEEVVQDAFFSFWRSRHHFDGTRGSVRTWILGIVRNRAIDVLRHSVAHEVSALADHDVAEALEARELTDREVSLRESAHELRAALEGLPLEQSRVIRLAYYGGYSHSEIAAMLDTPVGTVKGRMRLGLRKMAFSILATI